MGQSYTELLGYVAFWTSSGLFPEACRMQLGKQLWKELPHHYSSCFSLGSQGRSAVSCFPCVCQKYSVCICTALLQGRERHSQNVPSCKHPGEIWWSMLDVKCRYMPVLKWADMHSFTGVGTERQKEVDSCTGMTYLCLKFNNGNSCS